MRMERDACPRCGARWWPGQRECPICTWLPEYGEPAVPWRPDDERKQTYQEAETALEAEPEPSDKELEEEVREQMAEADLAALEAEPR